MTICVKLFVVDEGCVYVGPTNACSMYRNGVLIFVLYVYSYVNLYIALI